MTTRRKKRRLKKGIKKAIYIIISIVLVLLFIKACNYIGISDQDAFNECTKEHSQNYCIKSIYGIYP